MATAAISYAFPAEHEGFLAEFQALMKKHPEAAARFALADVGTGDKPQPKDGRPVELHCFQTPWGLICPLEEQQL
ncbi:hypothetical protein [Variovorax sp. KK3]|uniref:hypothetical protein n=1 Tax=Variovorax sp. KK3 TaxID=1855728 RepID=UPI00097C98D2|nr:hypothetical protein [Variovorax sp. KK3]